ncbi:MAG: tetratricopeptide repeat protein [Bacteroidia bacterium]|nr:tetratricopeptide repeat protein [Bacteroidia bacterium]
MRKLFLTLAIISFNPSICFCQIALEKQLLQKADAAKNDIESITALGELAEFYTIYRADAKADTILQKQLLKAELLNDKSLIIKTLFTSSINNIASTSSNETYNKALAFVEKGLAYAREIDDDELVVSAHLKKAALLRKKGMPDEAFQQINLALGMAGSIRNDSLKTELHIESGDVFFAKRDYVNAYKNYNIAYDLAYAIKNIPLQSATFHKFANIYRVLESPNEAKNIIRKSIELNKENKNPKGLMADCFHLFRIEEQIDYLNKAIFLSDSLQSIKDQLFGKRLRFISFYKLEKDSHKALAYLEQNDDLKQYFINQGIINYNIGSAYQYSGRFDSAIYYYLKDEAIITSKFSKGHQLTFYRELAECFKELNQTASSISYFEKAYGLSEKSGDLFSNDTIAQSLADLYAQEKNFERAYYFANLRSGYIKEIKNLSKQADITLMDIDREKKKHDKDLADALAAERIKREAQYLGISIATVFLFIILIVFGMFPISKVTIRMLNFVAFICLFEFIILLIDGWLHDLTHGAPLYIWLAKILIIALLLPLHHTLEHVAIKFLSSPKLQRFRQKLSIKKLLHPSKKTIKKIEENLEESTLV